MQVSKVNRCNSAHVIRRQLQYSTRTIYSLPYFNVFLSDFLYDKINDLFLIYGEFGVESNYSLVSLYRKIRY